MGAQREFELKDGANGRRLRRLPISAFTRVFDAQWAILDFKFSLRLPASVRFKGSSASPALQILARTDHHRPPRKKRPLTPAAARPAISSRLMVVGLL